MAAATQPTSQQLLDGVLVVSEKAPPRVKIYTSDGKFVAQSADGVFDENTKNIDLAADGRGRLYATDPKRWHHRGV